MEKYRNEPKGFSEPRADLTKPGCTFKFHMEHVIKDENSRTFLELAIKKSYVTESLFLTSTAFYPIFSTNNISQEIQVISEPETTLDSCLSK